MTLLKSLGLVVGAALLGTTGHAQPTADRLQFSQQRYQHTKTLGLTLGSYALANLAVSGLATRQTTGETHYFHQMNVYWNVVNLGIAGVGLLGLRKQHPETETLAQAVKQHESMKRTLLFNAGLDVAYVMGGLYLLERGRSRPDQRDKLRGYGKAVMAQGGFLFAFDLINYLIFKNQGDKQQFQLIGQTPLGVGIVLPLK